ncbi:hypothetical protein L249_1547 [Ophiocordyceps polyrhachis-furcata BCC 54312]|uniref:glutamate-5-semialdehyde dehydrogenase n=1 Tax=Ophiocordyceps polyrhachis-furcata BCC 54312 TaxID=1330021 RepID=A0A367L3Z3_9HYPO|nr:hypothetical protein L249_1547 [Ophiocordyceps polyrhachis-furcata BCC 54312]
MSLTNGSAEAAASAARQASTTLGSLPAEARNKALDSVHAALVASKEKILAANARDVERVAAADESADAALVSRLDLSRPGKWDDMLRGVRDVRHLDDPIGRIQMRTKLDHDLVLERVSCSFGVILVIFEARPEVIANISSLAIKSGNAAILKGGKESTESFQAIAEAISSALYSSAVPNDAIQLVTTRDAVTRLLQQDRYIDLIIPRGSNQLVRDVKAATRIPVLGHADGLCAMYLTASADAVKAAAAVVDAKTSYPAACNSVETLLVQEAGLNTVFPEVVKALVGRGVILRCDEAAKSAAVASLSMSSKSGEPPAELLSTAIEDAKPADFETEFLTTTLAVKTVADLEQAIQHINHHGSHHTDAILTADESEAETFMARVDSAGVYWNASTRVADGMRYGFGTEVGISTNKIHARGPVGLDGLTTYKYKLRGDYQPTAQYGDGKRPWLHETLPI